MFLSTFRVFEIGVNNIGASSLVVRKEVFFKLLKVKFYYEILYSVYLRVNY